MLYVSLGHQLLMDTERLGFPQGKARPGFRGGKGVGVRPPQRAEDLGGGLEKSIHWGEGRYECPGLAQTPGGREDRAQRLLRTYYLEYRQVPPWSGSPRWHEE